MGRGSLLAITHWPCGTSGLGGQVRATGVHCGFEGKATPSNSPHPLLPQVEGRANFPEVGVRAVSRTPGGNQSFERNISWPSPSPAPSLTRVRGPTASTPAGRQN